MHRVEEEEGMAEKQHKKGRRGVREERRKMVDSQGGKEEKE